MSTGLIADSHASRHAENFLSQKQQIKLVLDLDAIPQLPEADLPSIDLDALDDLVLRLGGPFDLSLADR